MTHSESEYVLNLKILREQIRALADIVGKQPYNSCYEILQGAHFASQRAHKLILDYEDTTHSKDLETTD